MTRNKDNFSKYCTQCGTCSGMCPTESIKMTVNEANGLYTPQLIGDSCIHCGICLRVCPSRSSGFGVALPETESSKGTLLGDFVRCYMSNASDEAIRYKASSGGLITSLLIFALDHGLIDGVLVTE